MINWQQFRSERKQRGRPFVVAHRGVPVLEPENTLRSFALALQQGADVLETDLRFTYDGQIVLFHDSTLERTTDGQGAVSDQTLQALQRLHTKTPDGSLTNAGVPTLLDLIEQTQSRTPFLLELKDPRFADPKYARQLIELLETHGVLQSSAIVSFYPAYVAWAHWLNKVVAPMDPTPEPRMWYYMALGVDAVLADNPATVIAAINHYQNRSL
jgi:glycerophosphoryl diester phosphodiesterase